MENSTITLTTVINPDRIQESINEHESVVFPQIDNLSKDATRISSIAVSVAIATEVREGKKVRVLSTTITTKKNAL